MKKIATLIYGAIAYLIFLATFLYAIGFIGNLVVPNTIDSLPKLPFAQALLINVALLSVFAIQHSVMARQGFKQWWTKIVPHQIERSTYVLFSSLCLILLFWQWQPLGGIIWEVTNQIGSIVFLSLFTLGWTIVLVSTFLINHFDLFGLRQVYLYFQGEEYTLLEFGTPGLYKYVRHPLYVGWFFAFWMTPKMTVAHFVFAMTTTVYILIAIQFEERDLVNIHGEAYSEYRRQVPMLIPFINRNKLEKENI